MIKVQSHRSTFEVEIAHDNTEASVNGKSMSLDVLRLDSQHFHLLINGRSWNAEIVSFDRASRICRVRVNGRELELRLKDRFDDLLERLGMNAQESARAREIKAPMPGMVLNVLVQEGDNVEKDTPLLILEAMKMENVIKSPAAGSVKRIGVRQGHAVEKNALLIEFA